MMGWIIAVLAVTVALMALRSRWKGKANACIQRAMRKYMEPHARGENLTAAAIDARARAMDAG